MKATWIIAVYLACLTVGSRLFAQDRPMDFDGAGARTVPTDQPARQPGPPPGVITPAVIVSTITAPHTPGCVDAAQARPIRGYKLSVKDSVDLCGEGFSSTAPAQCLGLALAANLNGGRLTIKNGLLLCRRTSSPAAPVDCLDRALAQTVGGYQLNLNGGISLCRGTSEPLAPLVCLDRTMAEAQAWNRPLGLLDGIAKCRSALR
ncbi:MAG: hypothetical protein WCW52_09590 [Elusimicrobiales bacterium]|jgi:hypothetical protein